MTTTASSKTAANLRVNDQAPAAGAPQATGPIGGLATWLDDRTGIAKAGNFLMKKVFPDHWSFMLGEIAMYSMIICLLSGTFLTFWFIPSAGAVNYHGSYLPLNGIEMSEAYASTLDISFDIRGGLLIRQIHHWGALVFVVAIVVHMMRVFFTGAFRKPREINWVIGCVLSMLALIEGFAGYSLPDDLLSGTGLRAAEGFMQSVPVLGSYVSYLAFGGPFPGEAIIPRLFIAHVLLIPALLVGLFTAHIVLVMVHKHTQYPGPGRTNNNVVGFPLMPVYTAKAGGFFFIVFGVITAISALVTINPIWAYGPYDPSPVTAGSQPDWYMGFADGALRLLPGWPLEFVLFDKTWSFNVAIGAVLLIPIVYGLAGAYPFFERWVTGDTREHHILDRPRNAPVRTAIGAAATAAYLVLFFAAGNDIMAIKLGLSINDITNLLRLLFFVLPIIIFWATKRICLALQRRDREIALHGRETGLNYMTPEGGFHGVHEPLDKYELWTLVDYDAPIPIEAGSDGTDRYGVANPKAASKRRATWSRFFFRDRIAAPTPAEVEAAAEHGHGHGHDEGDAGHGEITADGSTHSSH